jgi:hypothetical protein
MSTEVSRQVLEETPGRAITLLRALGTSPAIRALLAANGYTPKDHEEGWNLLHKVSGYVPGEAGPVDDDTKARDAITELDAWDEQGFQRAHAALTRLHPAQDRYIFDGLAPAKGPEAVLRVALFLDRLDALEGGPDRKATRKADRAALETLETRGITKAERTRLRALVGVAQSSPRLPIIASTAASSVEKRTEALRELRAWYNDWASTARAVVTRRDYLIRLGLARRKRAIRAAASPGVAGQSPSEP